MKTFKKLLALVLAVCMLIGMPLSIDVSAAGGGTATNAAISNPTTFQLQYAYPATDAMIKAANGRTSVEVGGVTYKGDDLKGRVLLLEFTGPVGNLYDQQTAKLWSGTSLAIEKSDGTAVHSFQWWNMGNWFTDSANPFYWILKDHTLTIGGKEYVIKSFDDIFALMEEGGPYAGLGYKLVYRLFEQGDGANKTNGLVDAYYNNVLKDQKLVANTKRGDFDCCMIEVTRPENMPRLEHVVRVDDNRLFVQFSEAITYRRTWTGVRIVNSQGRLLCYNANGWDGNANNKYDFKGSGHLQAGAGVGQGKAIHYISATLSTPFGSTGKSMDQHLADAQKEDPNAGYFMAFVMQSEDYNGTPDGKYGLNSNRGEYSYNWVCDNIWTTNGEKPLLATVTDKSIWTHDSLIMPIQSYEDFQAEKANEYLFLESATLVPAEGTERIFLKFSGAMSNTLANRTTVLRIYDRYNNLIYLDANGNPTTSTETGKALQWGCYPSAESHTNSVKDIIYIASTMVQNTSLCNAKTVAELRAWMNEKGMTAENGYKLCYSISQVNDPSYPSGDTKLESFYNGNKKLFANGYNGEDRAYVELKTVPETLAIQKVEVVNHNYVLIHFNQDVTWNSGMFAALALTPSFSGNELSWYDATKGYNTSTGTDLQASMSISHYGNSKNILLGTINQADQSKDKSFTWLKNHQDAAKAAGQNLQMCLRLNDSANDAKYLASFKKDEQNYFLDSWWGTNSGAYSGIWSGTNDWDRRNFPLADTDSSLSGVSVTVVDANTIQMEFNDSVIIEKSGYQVWLTKYKYENGDNIFNAYTAPGVLWQAQFDISTFAPVNPDKDGASRFWTVDLNSGNDAGSLGIASREARLQNTWTYGIRFEQQKANAAGINKYGIIDQVYTADGKYLFSNSNEAHYRHFIPLSVPTETDNINIVSAKVLNETTVQVKFDRPVRYTDGLVAVQVYNTENRVSKIDNVYVEFNCTMSIVGGANGYSDTWNMVSDSDYWTNVGITKFAGQFFHMHKDAGSNWYDDGTHRFGITFYDQSNAAPKDGMIGGVVDAFGNLLQAAPYIENPTLPTGTDRAREQAFASLMEDEYLLLDKSEITVDAVESNPGAQVLVMSTPGILAYGGTNTVRVYNGTDLVKIDGADAIWSTQSFSNYNNANNKFTLSIIGKFGCDTIDEIKTMLNNKGIVYTDIVLAIQESTTDAHRKGDGNICNWYMGADRKYVPMLADIKDATNGDIALFPIVDGNAEMLHITDVSLRKNNASNNYLLEMTMSHPMDMDVFFDAISANQLAVWLGAKHVDAFQLINSTGAASDTGTVYHTNISKLLDPISDTKLIAEVSATEAEKLLTAINTTWPGKAELAIRFEHKTSPAGTTGAHGQSGYMIPSNNANVLATVLNANWGGKTGRVWTDVAIGEATTVQALYNGAGYASVIDAVEAANTNGGKVVLVTNSTVNDVDGIITDADVVLDINGKTLTMAAGSVIGNGHIIDSKDGKGLIKIDLLADNQMVLFATNNPQLPLYDSTAGGYRLFNTKVTSLGTKNATADSCKYGFKVTFDNASAYTFLKDTANNDTTVFFSLDTERLAKGYENLPLKPERLAEYAQHMIDTPTENWAFTLVLSGLAKLEGDALTVSGCIRSAGTVMNVTIPVTNS